MNKKPKRNVVERSIAVLTVFDAAETTPAGRKEIARWLRRQATFLEKVPKEGLEGGYCAQYRADAEDIIPQPKANAKKTEQTPKRVSADWWGWDRPDVGWDNK